jgi:hypothetical protein
MVPTNVQLIDQILVTYPHQTNEVWEINLLTKHITALNKIWNLLLWKKGSLDLKLGSLQLVPLEVRALWEVRTRTVQFLRSWATPWVSWARQWEEMALTSRGVAQALCFGYRVLLSLGLLFQPSLCLFANTLLQPSPVPSKCLHSSTFQFPIPRTSLTFQLILPGPTQLFLLEASDLLSKNRTRKGIGGVEKILYSGETDKLYLG